MRYNDYMRVFLIILVLLFSLAILAEGVEAKVLPQAKKATGTKAVKSTGNSTGTTIGVSPKMRADKKALIVNFSNLQNASLVSYFLTYKTGIQQEGAGGTLNLSGSSGQSAELLFGTCSKNVCRYHTNIKNAKLEVTYTSKSGKKYLKRYKIRV